MVLVSEQELFSLQQQAQAIRDHAYAPYSHFLVGAAVLTTDHHVFTGVNIENASFGLTICAERVALFKTIEAQEKPLALAVCADTPGPVSPCGACRQVMCEFMDPQALIRLINLDHAVQDWSLDKLLPGSFMAQDMKESRNEH